MAAVIMTPSQVATEFGTDARTMRKFLRSITPKDAQPGKGSRWEIKKAELRGLRKKFTEFTIAQENAKNERTENAKNAVPEAEVELEENALEENEENGPSDEELAEIEND